jgi:isopentenyl-diphosphate delta-isomerase
MAEEHVILVNEKDQEIGLMPKLEAHQRLFYIELFLFLFLTLKTS